MSTRQQKIQLELGFVGRAQGEARRDPEGRAVVRTATEEAESPADDIMAQVLARENLREAMRKVKRGGRSPGVDGMTIEQLPGYLSKHWPTSASNCKPEATGRTPCGG